MNAHIPLADPLVRRSAVTTIEPLEPVDVVVRHEFCGPLLWSNRRHAFFLPRESSENSLVTRAIERKRAGQDWDDGSLPASLADDLRDLGLGGRIREIRSPYQNRLSGPLEIYFDYTWLCNLARHKCGQDSFCYAAEFLGPTTMREQRVRELMAELAQWGVMRVHLAGGEPTINKRALANYLDSAGEQGLYTSMATNGLLIDDETLDIILRNKLKSVSFSIDGASEETFAAVRGPGLFDKVVAALRYTVRRKRETGSDMRVCVKPTYTPSTPYSELEALVELGIDAGADVVKFANPERCLHHEQGFYSQQVDEYYAAIEFIGQLQKAYGSQISITNVSNPMAGCGDIGIPGLSGCIGGQELIALNPDGSVTPCLMHPRKLGNIDDQFTGLRDFWNGSTQLTDFWKALEKPEGCSGCDIYSSCRSGSTTRRIVQIGRFDPERTTGDFSAVKDPLCTRDYLARHPEKKLPEPAEDPTALRHFREIAVRHSL
ncbi:radical SAM protein [Streptomyces sp. NPDC048045]|uniref:radical SAM/SPASM domain-containing protein n=1 Tax=Streptomyces sp. NPDC048045 TaxID=3154710 RepID=UPI003418DD23